MDDPPAQPGKKSSPLPRHGRTPRRLRLTPPEPVRRLGHITHLLTLTLGMALLALWQNVSPPLSRDASVTLSALVLLYISVGLYMVQNLRDIPSPTRPHPPSTARPGRKRGRPRAIPSGHSEEAARQKYHQLRELRSQGATWQEAARAVNLSVRQAQHLAKHFPVGLFGICWYFPWLCKPRVPR